MYPLAVVELASLLLKQGIEICGSDIALAAHFDEQRYSLICWEKMHPETDFERVIGDSLSGLVYHKKQTQCLCEGVSLDHILFCGRSIKYYLGIPILCHDECWGVLEFINFNHHGQQPPKAQLKDLEEGAHLLANEIRIHRI